MSCDVRLVLQLPCCQQSRLCPEQSGAGLAPCRQGRAAGGTPQEVTRPQEPVQKGDDAPAQGLLAYGREEGCGGACNYKSDGSRVDAGVQRLADLLQWGPLLQTRAVQCWWEQGGWHPALPLCFSSAL